MNIINHLNDLYSITIILLWSLPIHLTYKTNQFTCLSTNYWPAVTHNTDNRIELHHYCSLTLLQKLWMTIGFMHVKKTVILRRKNTSNGCNRIQSSQFRGVDKQIIAVDNLIRQVVWKSRLNERFIVLILENISFVKMLVKVLGSGCGLLCVYLLEIIIQCSVFFIVR